MASSTPSQSAEFEKLGLCHYLSLREVRLGRGRPWVNALPGLVLVFVRKGTVSVVPGGLPRALVKGDVLVANQTGKSPLRLSSAKPGVFVCFTVTPEQLYPLFSSEEIPALQEVLAGLGDPKFYDASSSVAIRCHKTLGKLSKQSELQTRAELLRIAATVLSKEFNEVPGRSSEPIQIDEQLARILASLTTDDFLRLSVKEMATKFNISRRHLNRLFHGHFGLSIGGLRMEMRLLRAMSLLQDPHAKVIHVAEQSGFNHLGLFNTCFKRRFGMNPSQCRKKSVKSFPAPAAQFDSTCALRAAGLCAWVERDEPRETPA